MNTKPMTGIYCPATRMTCDRPCLGAECQRVKLFGGRTDGARPPPPDLRARMHITAAQLRAARAYLDLTMSELAIAAGVSHQTVCRLERGFSIRTQDRTLRKIVGVFYDRGIDLFGTKDTHRGIRDFLPQVSGPKK